MKLSGAWLLRMLACEPATSSRLEHIPSQTSSNGSSRAEQVDFFPHSRSEYRPVPSIARSLVLDFRLKSPERRLHV